MNGLATRSALVQAAEQANSAKPRPPDLAHIVMAEPRQRRSADRIVGAVGVVGVITIVLWLLLEQLARHLGGAL